MEHDAADQRNRRDRRRQCGYNLGGTPAAQVVRHQPSQDQGCTHRKGCRQPNEGQRWSKEGKCQPADKRREGWIGDIAPRRPPRVVKCVQFITMEAVLAVRQRV